jgi:hypothetical protein
MRRWQYSLTAPPGDSMYPDRQSMTPKHQMNKVNVARQRMSSVAIWRGLRSLIKGCIGGWASGTD